MLKANTLKMFSSASHSEQFYHKLSQITLDIIIVDLLDICIICKTICVFTKKLT